MEMPYHWSTEMLPAVISDVASEGK